ncbi:MAG: glycosyltransferase family 2 protein [Methanothrix sp.]
MDKLDYIIPTWNSAATLPITLKSIEKYGNPNQIIVVDRNSDDETIAIAKSFGCKIIESTKPLGAARRIGAKNAETELIAFVDSDVELSIEWKGMIKCAAKKEYKDAGVIGGYYKSSYLTNMDHPIALIGGTGAFGCCITYTDLIIEYEELDKFSSAEDSAYAKFLEKRNLKWYIMPVPLVHHQDLTSIQGISRWRWMGAGLRMRDGFSIWNIKRILGGAIFGIRISNLDISYVQNFKLRWNYFEGYMLYKKYYELDRGIPPKKSVKFF